MNLERERALRISVTTVDARPSRQINKRTLFCHFKCIQFFLLFTWDSFKYDIMLYAYSLDNFRDTLDEVM